MARLSPQDAAAKWASRTSAASGDYQKGVAAVTTAPGQLAAQKKEKFRAGIQEALDSGKWEQRVAAVSLQSWKEAASTKGASRLGQGVQAAVNKMAGFMSEFLPFQESVMQRADQMPDNTLEERIQKSAFVQRETARFRRSGGR